MIVEKPFTPTSAEADELLKIAKDEQRLLTVYHSMCIVLPLNELIS